MLLPRVCFAAAFFALPAVLDRLPDAFADAFADGLASALAFATVLRLAAGFAAGLDAALRLGVLLFDFAPLLGAALAGDAPPAFATAASNSA